MKIAGLDTGCTNHLNVRLRCVHRLDVKLLAWLRPHLLLELLVGLLETGQEGTHP